MQVYADSAQRQRVLPVMRKDGGGGVKAQYGAGMVRCGWCWFQREGGVPQVGGGGGKLPQRQLNP